MQGSSFYHGPSQTPRSVKGLMWVITIISLVAPIVTFVLWHYWNLPGPQQWLSLSSWGLEKGWLWQPFTYFFLHSGGIDFSVSLLLSLTFHLVLLWFAGSEVALRLGEKTFLLFYLGAGLFAGLLTALVLYFSNSSGVVVGNGPPLYALLILWAMLSPRLEFFLLFFIRFQAKWLVIGLLGFVILSHISRADWMMLTADLSGIGWGLAVGKWVFKSPIPFLKKKPKDRAEKIVDITLIHEEDEAFVDRMLEKISREGKESLTKGEEARLKKISERKKR